MTKRAVLFDWRGTLVTTARAEVWIRQALEGLDRPAEEVDVAAVMSALDAANGVEDRLDTPGMDTDAALHHRIFMEVTDDAGLDRTLAQALYDLEADPEWNRFALDALPTLLGLRERGVAVAVVSDIHFDIRPLFDAAGLGGLVDHFMLSFEEGIQKPHPEMFLRPLRALQVAPSDALMVGDRSRPDGPAVEQGIPTLLLPPLTDPADRRLHQVLALMDAPDF